MIRCNHDCKSGRTCPARLERLASAARMTTASHHDEPVSDAHDKLLHLFRWLTLTFAMFSFFAAITGLTPF